MDSRLEIGLRAERTPLSIVVSPRRCRKPDAEQQYEARLDGELLCLSRTSPLAPCLRKATRRFAAYRPPGAGASASTGFMASGLSNQPARQMPVQAPTRHRSTDDRQESRMSA